jgi:hypothetical protein
LSAWSQHPPAHTDARRRRRRWRKRFNVGQVLGLNTPPLIQTRGSGAEGDAMSCECVVSIDTPPATAWWATRRGSSRRSSHPSQQTRGPSRPPRSTSARYQGLTLVNFQLNVSTFCGLHASTFRLDMSTFCWLELYWEAALTKSSQAELRSGRLLWLQ